MGELAAKGDSRAQQQQDEVDLSDKVTYHSRSESFFFN
jgi:hypothetical protein